MFSASFTIPVQPAATADPSTRQEGCSALWWFSQAQPGLPGLPYKGLWVALAVCCPTGVTVLRGWGGTGAGPGADINGKWSQWALETHWLYLIWEKAEPAVIGQCRGTAVLLITCIKKYMKINWSISVQLAPAVAPGLHCGHLLACPLSSPGCKGGFDSFSVLSYTLDCT